MSSSNNVVFSSAINGYMYIINPKKCVVKVSVGCCIALGQWFTKDEMCNILSFFFLQDRATVG